MGWSTPVVAQRMTDPEPKARPPEESTTDQVNGVAGGSLASDIFAIDTTPPNVPPRRLAGLTGRRRARRVLLAGLGAAALVTGLTLAINAGGRNMIHPPPPRPAAVAQANSTTSTPTSAVAAESSTNGVSVFPPPGAAAPAGPTPGSAVDTPTPTPTPPLQGADNSGKTKGKHRRGD